MKNKLRISLFILALSLFFVTCGSTPQVDKPASKSVQPVDPFYTGSGGKDISLAILAPKTTGLTKDQGYIPALVQGEFVSNFSGYSALSVMDRENLDNVYGELLSGYYDDRDEAGLDLGHLTSTDYLMNGSITKTAAGYALQMQITKTADKMTAASYSGTCTFMELDNLTGIRRVSLDLLQKMGIELTDRAKTDLAGAAAANHVNAQTALARGITAQQGGTVVEALSYYYQAAAFDPSLLEAANRADVVSAGISSGNIGTNVRNDIERRKEWLKILEEAENYFKNHQPWEIVYNFALTQGEVDYERETVSLSFDLEVRPTEDWKIVQSLIDGLDKTGKRDEWGLTWWPLTSRVFTDYVNDEYGSHSLERYIDRAGLYSKRTTIVCDLLNEKGKLLASETVNCISKATFEKNDFANYTGGPPKKGYIQWVGSDYGYVIHNDVISTAMGVQKVVFKNVNANDITENMTVKIISVNGIVAENLAKNGYINISTM
ncbi:hypothetical protein FACS189485_02610 [Spirochaetia bacterium]|nr:hypothetical protein FACS189485_02610 [Spirochaetia bacterium]